MDPAGPSFYSTPPKGGYLEALTKFMKKVLITPYEESQISPPHERLDLTDAKELQAIHTNKPSLGIIPSIGHADFYLSTNIDNLGDAQPGCNIMMKNLVAQYVPAFLAEMLDKMDPIGFCSHTRVPHMVEESIKDSDTCWAHVHCDPSKDKDPKVAHEKYKDASKVGNSLIFYQKG